VPGEWIALRVDVPCEIADAVANFLLEAGSPAVIVEAATEHVLLSASVPAAVEDSVRVALARYLASLAEIEPAARRARTETAPVAPLDWDEVARRHHRPLAVGRRLVVAPPWDVPEAPGREVLVIEPGMAFGTGQHATTRACLEAIEAAVSDRPIETALDVGTGSGILALALARLGVARVVALDVDPAVLRLARRNLDRNGATAVAVVGGSAAALRGWFDLVVANLLADTILAEAAVLAGAVVPRGRLILSGILDLQAAAVERSFPGWQVIETRAEDAWRTLALERDA